MTQTYPPPRVVAIDVDGTLIGPQGVNRSVVAWALERKQAGYSLILWSSRGEAHARKAAEIAGMTEAFDHILSKPGYVLDDQGWGWIKYTRVVGALL